MSAGAAGRLFVLGAVAVGAVEHEEAARFVAGPPVRAEVERHQRGAHLRKGERARHRPVEQVAAEEDLAERRRRDVGVVEAAVEVVVPQIENLELCHRREHVGLDRADELAPLELEVRELVERHALGVGLVADRAAERDTEFGVGAHAGAGARAGARARARAGTNAREPMHAARRPVRRRRRRPRRDDEHRRLDDRVAPRRATRRALDAHEPRGDRRRQRGLDDVAPRLRAREARVVRAVRPPAGVAHRHPHHGTGIGEGAREARVTGVTGATRHDEFEVVRSGVRLLPEDVDPRDLVRRAEVDRQPLVVGRCRLPPRVLVAVDRPARRLIRGRRVGGAADADAQEAGGDRDPRRPHGRGGYDECDGERAHRVCCVCCRREQVFCDESSACCDEGGRASQRLDRARRRERAARVQPPDFSSA